MNIKLKTVKLSGLQKFTIAAVLTLIFVLSQQIVPLIVASYAMGHFYFEIGH